MSETLRERLIRHEGLRLRAYNDSLGYMTVGVGRNLQTKGISEDEAFYMLDHDIEDIQEAVAKAFPWSLGLDEARLSILQEMVFQLGIGRVQGFQKMLAALRGGDYAAAAKEMRASVWHMQTPLRCEELAEMMVNGNT